MRRRTNGRRGEGTARQPHPHASGGQKQNHAPCPRSPTRAAGRRPPSWWGRPSFRPARCVRVGEEEVRGCSRGGRLIRWLGISSGRGLLAPLGPCSQAHRSKRGKRRLAMVVVGKAPKDAGEQGRNRKRRRCVRWRRCRVCSLLPTCFASRPLDTPSLSSRAAHASRPLESLRLLLTVDVRQPDTPKPREIAVVSLALAPHACVTIRRPARRPPARPGAGSRHLYGAPVPTPTEAGDAGAQWAADGEERPRRAARYPRSTQGGLQGEKLHPLPPRTRLAGSVRG